MYAIENPLFTTSSRVSIETEYSREMRKDLSFALNATPIMKQNKIHAPKQHLKSMVIGHNILYLFKCTSIDLVPKS